jgi:ABC-2 type transport system ATP-binding protein
MPDAAAAVPVPALRIRALVKRFASTAAVDGVDLDVPAGEIFALLGPNGAGKTTLIHCVAGLARPTAGRIEVFGHDTVRAFRATRRLVGLVPQEIVFDPFFTPFEALVIQMGLMGVRPDPAYAEQLLRTFALSDQRDAYTRTLSGGMKRRLLVAKALVHRPKLLFLDEPTAGVDVELRKDLWAEVRALRAAGTTIILTTHYLEEAEQLADRIGVIHRGRLVLVERREALLARRGEDEQVKRVTLEDVYVDLIAAAEGRR